jgi:hypothetical protein
MKALTQAATEDQMVPPDLAPESRKVQPQNKYTELTKSAVAVGESSQHQPIARKAPALELPTSFFISS